MKRLFALFLALLLLCGCAPEPTPTETAPTAETAPATTEAAPLAGLSDLSEGFVLLYEQANLDDRRGTLVSLEALLAAPEEDRMPRTHFYDDRFPGDAALWLQLLDCVLAQGYQGFSVPEGTLTAIDTTQRRALEFTYRIDGGKVLTMDRDGCTTVWYDCAKHDTMEKFVQGLAAARELAAEAPRGDDWETALWIMDALADRITYGERDSYYFKRGHMLFDALVDGDTVCSGYSAGMYYLCSLCGLECIEVQGLCASLEKAGGLDDHVWDFVEICGSWYCYDPTWYDSDARDAAPVFCGLSEEVLYAVGLHKRTGEYTDESMLPVCDACFDPAAAWNGSPEGALRSWLLYASFAAADPSYLLLYAGLMTPETAYTMSDDHTQAVVDVPYSDYAAWAERFLGGDALEPARFSETEDGKLLLQLGKTDSGIDWSRVTLVSVTAGADGSYTADLGAASAVFTVSKNEEGLYRVETITLTPNP